MDITGSNCLKGVLGKVIVDEKGIKDSWKEYMERLMNEENEWDHRISAGVKEDHQIASGSMKLLQHWKRLKDSLIRASRCVVLSYKIEFHVKGWETRIRWHNLGSTAKQVAIGMCCENKTMIGWRDVWSMNWRALGQEVDQRKLGDR